MQQAKESVKINAGSSYLFFLLSFGQEMADAGVGRVCREEEQLCVSCFGLYEGKESD